MRNYLLPRTYHAGSRRWSFWVNTVAASPYLGDDARKRLYRSLGMDISDAAYEIGARCYIHSSEITIGPRTFINGFCWFENVARVSIGAGVAIGPRVAIITSSHRIGPSSARASGGWHYSPVTLGDGCWIGAGALIQPGVTIGSGGIVAPGAVVAADTEPDSLYGGVPARRIRGLDDSVAEDLAHSLDVESPPRRQT
jgi:maltose O-acetyltransferase